MVLVSYKLDNHVGLLQTKLSYREGHEARRIGPALSISSSLGNESSRCHMTPVFIGAPGGRLLFGTTRMFAVFREPDRRGEFAQHLGQHGWRHGLEHRPVRGRDRDHHAVV